jgi:hypothetical protein
LIRRFIESGVLASHKRCNTSSSFFSSSLGADGKKSKMAPVNSTVQGYINRESYLQDAFMYPDSTGSHGTGIWFPKKNVISASNVLVVACYVIPVNSFQNGQLKVSCVFLIRYMLACKQVVYRWM